VREIVILLLVVALLVLVIGAVNQDQRVDLDYVFGTWEGVSVLTLSAISAGAAIVMGLIIAAMARMRVVADRRKLERELQLVYPRLREAERAAGLPAWNMPVETVAPAAAGVAVAPASEPTAGEAEATEGPSGDKTPATTEGSGGDKTPAPATAGESGGDEAPAAGPVPPPAAAEAEVPAPGAAEPESSPNGEA
jgi:uncharacterized membrane protein YciS (DUF1049 family)